LHEDADLPFLGPTIEPLIIGIANTIAAGRTTAVRRLQAVHGFQAYSLAEQLKKLAVARGLTTDRSTLQSLGTELRNRYGDAFLAERLRHSRQWLSGTSALVVVDGFKHSAEVNEFRKQRSFSLLGITAGEQVRWERVRRRRRHGDPKTLQDFRELDAIDRGLTGAPHSQQTDHLLESLADFVIVNEGSLSEFESELDLLVERLFHPR
jgi:dephospho-CoA kinase